ncbi:MAG: hypothetical protein V7642_430 [Burkholderiales bacterium]|jgi:hypothetical protein
MLAGACSNSARNAGAANRINNGHFHLAAYTGVFAEGEYEMTQLDVVKLFNAKAKDLGDDHTTEDNTIWRLAQFLADSEARLSKEDFDFLTHMGALMYKHGLGQYTARADVAAVMSKSARRLAKE